jgi:hypothetical protein
MNIRPPFLLGLLTLLGWGAASVPACAGESLYHFLKEIPLGGPGRWDYLFVDSPAQRLYMSHDTEVVVIDLAKDQKTAEIADTPGVHGFTVAAEFQRGFSSNGRENKVSVVDLNHLQTIAKVDAGQNPDAILYEPNQKEIYAFNGRGHSATVIAAGTGKAVATIPLPGKPEFAACDPKAGRIYDNLEDKNAVAVIDTAKHEVVATWPIAPGESASGMAIDLEHHRLFLGCDNQLLVMMDSASGEVVATVPIGRRVDAVCFDPATQLAFTSNGEGNVTLAREESPGELTVVQTLATEPGAKTMALDPATHKIYLGSAKFQPAQAGKRPAPISGTFKLLIYGMDNPPAR